MSLLLHIRSAASSCRLGIGRVLARHGKVRGKAPSTSRGGVERWGEALRASHAQGKTQDKENGPARHVGLSRSCESLMFAFGELVAQEISPTQVLQEPAVPYNQDSGTESAF